VQFELEPGEGQDDTWGNLVASSEGDKAVICAWEMPDIAPDQTFQLWLIEPDGGIHSGGIFRADPDIAYIPVPLDRPLNTYQAVGVSIEPAGGSADGPTGPRVFRVYINS
jgi:anti-sigma-K factor RskA